MNRFAVLRTRRGLLVIAALVAAVIVALVLALSGDDDGAPSSTSAGATSEPTTPAPGPSTTATPTPTTTPTTSVTCEGPTTTFNVEGVEQDSLLPDCGTEPVSTSQQEESGLGLACGGTYPVILYKTTTDTSRSSVCGVDSSGAKLRVVVAPDGGSPKDLAGSYEYQLDAFVAKDGGTTYVIQAYDGTLLIKRDGSTTTQASDDWISLDNEADYD